MFLRRVVNFTIFLTVCIVAPFAAAAQPAVIAVRTGLHPDYTRLVLELSDSIDFNVFALDDPYRVVIDLPELSWAAAPPRSGLPTGVVTGMRFGLFREGNSRIVLDVNGPVLVQAARILPPKQSNGHRFVLDLKATDRQRFLASLPATPVKAPAQGRKRANRGVGVPLPKSKPGHRGDVRRVIVIDAGHGGVDPGTIGYRGTYEKTLVLKYAKELQRKLQARGRYRVVLTRQNDVFLRLRDRVRTAQNAAADLFLSIHADSIKDKAVRGGAVYTLSERASDKEAAALADKENRSDAIAGVNMRGHDDQVVSILIDLAQRETMNFSARFANTLVAELERQRIRVRRKPHRFAGFRVLKAPDVPSVLVELGYLSNPKEERWLSSKPARAVVTRAIADAIDRYFAALKS